MKPGDLARLRDIGIRSGQIVLILKVEHYYETPDGNPAWTAIDYLHNGEIWDYTDSGFFEPVQDEPECGKMQV